MKSNKSYIFKNIYGTMYEFYINKDNDLMCNKFSEETKILENVSKFNINVTYLGIIEIVCITLDGFIKYCKLDKKWSTQTLYKLKSDNSSIDEVTLFSKKNKLHIFFMFYENKLDSYANILHYVWNGDKFKTNLVSTINIIDGLKKHYYLETIDETINMFYITKEKDSNVMSSCKYSTKDSWTNPKKLYRLNGNNISFSTLEKNNEFNILNLSNENKISTLEHVKVDSKNNIKNIPIYKTKGTIDTATFNIFNNILYCVWSENNQLMYSSFNNIKWSSPSTINTESYNDIYMYRYIYEESPLDDSIKGKNVFASISNNINIFLPQRTKTYNNKNNKCDAEGTIRKLLQEISEKKTINYDLKNKSLLLTEKLREKNIRVNNLSENINKISIQKSNIENKYKSTLQLNNKLKIQTQDFKESINKKSEKIELLKIRLKEKIDESNNLKVKFNEKSEEINSLNNKFNNKTKELNDIITELKNNTNGTNKSLENKYNIQIENIKKQLQEKENQFKTLLEKNKNLEKSIEDLKLENNNMEQKLEESKNNILLELKNKYDIESSSIKKQLDQKKKSFDYIADYTKQLESSLEQLRSENSLIKEQLENSKSKSFIERILGKPYK
ncbi:hypothetical protein [Clostridium oceanicum]|uniref:Chromosome partition protein Smc n=1 Tax=Clostridium oceanicum TaxID=1543 RepID=A0ABP3UK46_9CLOT